MVRISNICIFGIVQLKHDLIGHMKENWIQEQLVVILLLMLNALGSFFEMENERFLEEVEFEKEDNIRNVVFEEEFSLSIIVQETTLVIGDDLQTTIPDIVPEHDYDEVLPQTPIEKPQQP
ncbi:hypothetical protein CR513_02030, partial [Mucuna pruriens]